WKLRSDDGKQAVLDVGDWGSVIFKQAPVERAVVESFCFGIEPWSSKRVETELRKRGLTPIAENDGHGFESFHVKDPDGFDLQISNRPLNKSPMEVPGVLMITPFQPTNWKTVWLDHISFSVTNYKESVAFYSALLGWKPTGDEGSQNECEIGDVGNIIIRGGNPAAGVGGGRAGGGAPNSLFDSTGGRGGQAAAPV